MKKSSSLKSWILAIIFIAYFTAQAQQPTKEEMEQMKKIMEQMKADPEMQKAMKQAGIDMSTVENSMKAVETNGLGNYYEFSDFQTPKRDDARIAAVPKKILTNSELTAHLSKAGARVNSALSADDRKIIDLLTNKTKTYPADSLSQLANGLWVAANYLPSVYFMGLASQKKPDVENLNNYAAFLVMLGGEELALPILQKINRENPKSSTILNNIGQAWFGLGDLNQATKYLDSTIMIFATHSQANMTKCVIQESKGDKAGAVESLKKSAKSGYSTTKEDMLRKLGYKLDGSDLDDDLDMPQDPLGFDKIIARIPPFPKSMEESIELGPQWNDLYADSDADLLDLQAKSKKLKEEYAIIEVKKYNALRANPNSTAMHPPYLSGKARIILEYYTNDKDGHRANQDKVLASQMEKMGTTLKTAEDIYKKKQKAILEKYGVVGEGIKGPEGDECQELKTIFNEYIKVTNSAWETVFFAYLNNQKKNLEAGAYYTQFITDNQAMIDFVEANNKVLFLQNISSNYSSLHPNLGHSLAVSCPESEKNSFESKKLNDWNDLHCDKDVRFRVIGAGYMRFTCNTSEFHLEPLLIPIEVHYKDNLETGEVISASAAVSFTKEIAGQEAGIKIGAGYDGDKGTVRVEGGASTTIGTKNLGGVPIGVEAGGKAFIEFDKNGMSDLGVEAGVKVEAGNKAASTSLEGTAKWSWNAGGSGEAKGSFGGVAGSGIK